MLTKDMIREIRTMLERHWSAVEIAHKLKLDEQDVAQAVRTLIAH